jgi:hypothetical protein
MRDLFLFYTIGQPSNPTAFEITRFEEIEAPDLDGIEDPHKHTFYEIIWVDAGRSTSSPSPTTKTCPWAASRSVPSPPNSKACSATSTPDGAWPKGRCLGNNLKMRMN